MNSAHHSNIYHPLDHLPTRVSKGCIQCSKKRLVSQTLKGMKFVTVALVIPKFQIRLIITYLSIIFKLILLPILAVIQQDYIEITTRSHNNIIELIIVILNFSI